MRRGNPINTGEHKPQSVTVGIDKKELDTIGGSFKVKIAVFKNREQTDGGQRREELGDWAKKVKGLRSTDW